MRVCGRGLRLGRWAAEWNGSAEVVAVVTEVRVQQLPVCTTTVPRFDTNADIQTGRYPIEHCCPNATPELSALCNTASKHFEPTIYYWNLKDAGITSQSRSNPVGSNFEFLLMDSPGAYRLQPSDRHLSNTAASIDDWGARPSRVQLRAVPSRHFGKRAYVL